jgi:hypothetical protein
MTLYVLPGQSSAGGFQGLQPRNALLQGAPPPASSAPAVLPPAVQSQLVKSVIGHAAVLSDTPEKWAATIELLRQHGIDPQGYENFDKGRPLAIIASGIGPLPGENPEPSDDNS